MSNDPVLVLVVVCCCWGDDHSCGRHNKDDVIEDDNDDDDNNDEQPVVAVRGVEKTRAFGHWCCVCCYWLLLLSHVTHTIALAVVFFCFSVFLFDSYSYSYSYSLYFDYWTPIQFWSLSGEERMNPTTRIILRMTILWLWEEDDVG